MTAEEFLKKREAYAYPAVGLDGTLDDWELASFPSTWKMDRHHQELLMSRENTRIVMGYLSTVFWGHYSGQDGRIREARAKSRVKLALGQIRSGGAGVGSVGPKIRAAFALLKLDRCGEALSLLCALPQLGPALRPRSAPF